MKYEKLSHSGLFVSSLCFGKMMYGGTASETFSKGIIDHALDHRINFIDNADIYNAGESKLIVIRSIPVNPKKWVLITKVGNGSDAWPNQKGLSRRQLVQAIEQSLQRLEAEYVDIYCLHRHDPATPLVKTLHTLSDPVAQGEVRYYGLSNFSAWQVSEIVNIAKAIGIDGHIVSQLCYNAANRMPEVEHLPAYAYRRLGRPWRDAVQPPGKGHADCQIFAGQLAGRRQQDRSWRQACAANQVAGRVIAAGSGTAGACEEERRKQHRARDQLCIEKSHRDLGHRLIAHARAMTGLPGGAGPSLRPYGAARPPEHAQLHRSLLSGYGTCAARGTPCLRLIAGKEHQ